MKSSEVVEVSEAEEVDVVVVVLAKTEEIDELAILLSYIR
jgi:hypothetical protein